MDHMVVSVAASCQKWVVICDHQRCGHAGSKGCVLEQQTRVPKALKDRWLYLKDRDDFAMTSATPADERTLYAEPRFERLMRSEAPVPCPRHSRATLRPHSGVYVSLIPLIWIDRFHEPYQLV